MKYLTIILILFSQSIFAQDKRLGQTIAKIDLGQDTIKAVYDWVTNNVRYDVKKLSNIEDGSIYRKQQNYRTEEEFNKHLLKEVLETRKGVCQDYSLLFDAILKELGFSSFIVEGFTKDNRGQLNRKVGHTWNAVKSNGKWALYDPTWGAGYVTGDKKFVKAYKLEWYKADPKEMIKTHMPMDPIWQLSPRPIAYEDFIDNQLQNSFDKSYDFPTLIDQFLKQDEKEQLKAQVDRSQEMKSSIRLIDAWQKRLSKQAAQYGINSNLDSIDAATDNSNEAVTIFNEYIKAKNKQFKGKKYTIDKAKELLVEAKSKTSGSLSTYKSIAVEDKKALKFLNQSIRSSESLLKRIDKEITFLDNL